MLKHLIAIFFFYSLIGIAQEKPADTISITKTVVTDTISVVRDTIFQTKLPIKITENKPVILYDTLQTEPFILLQRRKPVAETVTTQTEAIDSSAPLISNFPTETKPETPINIDFQELKQLIQDVPDNAYAANIDQSYLQELYSNDLYDTINHLRYQIGDTPVYYPQLTKDTLIARLQRLNERTPFNIEYNPILESVIKTFLKNRQNSLQRLMGLAHYYFPIFEQELDAFNMPLEMKYLAIVESALNPRAKSRVGATGLWQFMYPTGLEEGLGVSSYVDERSDLLKSTRAACRYLTKCYNRFGDWDLALASYNSGMGNVSKAIRRSGGSENYWNIRSFLPRETAGYVPIFQATMYVFEYAKEHNFKPDAPRYQFFETDTIRVRKKLGLEHVAELFDIKMEDLQFLNPSYKLNIIPVVKGENYTLRLPIQYIGKFVTHENAIYAYAEKEFNKREKALPELVSSSSRIRYRVRSGDFLGKIARKYGVKVSQLKRWNGLKSNSLKIGQRLTIHPRHPQKTASKKKSIKQPTKPSKYKTASSYTVQSGDSLYGIAKKYSGVSAQNIQHHNNLSNNSLKPGMVLKIPKG